MGFKRDDSACYTLRWDTLMADLSDWEAKAPEENPPFAPTPVLQLSLGSSQVTTQEVGL